MVFHRYGRGCSVRSRVSSEITWFVLGLHFEFKVSCLQSRTPTSTRQLRGPPPRPVLQAPMGRAWWRRWDLLGSNYRHRTATHLLEGQSNDCMMVRYRPSVYLWQANDPSRTELGQQDSAKRGLVLCTASQLVNTDVCPWSSSLKNCPALVQLTVATPHLHFLKDDKRNYRHVSSEPKSQSLLIGDFVINYKVEKAASRCRWWDSDGRGWQPSSKSH